MRPQYNAIVSEWFTEPVTRKEGGGWVYEFPYQPQTHPENGLRYTIPMPITTVTYEWYGEDKSHERHCS